jgi:hypothetical protein
LYRAFDFLLSPCCTPSISATAVCVGSTYTVTLTLASSFNFGSNSRAALLIYPVTGNIEIGGIETYLGGDTIVFTTVSATAGAATLQLELFLPTNTTLDSGVVTYSNIVNITFPVCP